MIMVESIRIYLLAHPKFHFWLDVFIDLIYDFIKILLFLLLVFVAVHSAFVAVLTSFLDVAQDTGLFVLLEQALMGVIG